MEVKGLAEIPLEFTDLVLLDLDNTLYDYHSCHRYAVSKLVGEVTRLYSIDAKSAYTLYEKSRSIVHNINKGTAASHSRLFYIQGMLESILDRTDPEAILSLYRIYWDSFMDQMRLFDLSAVFLELCFLQKIPVILVTDMTAVVQFEKLKKLGISRYMSFVVTSEEAGVEKPHPFIFELAISKALKLNPVLKNVIVIGDDPKKDIHTSSVYSIINYHVIN